MIKPSSLGDIVHALPVLAALRRGYPRAHIAWLVGTTFVPFLEGHPLLDEVIPFDRQRYGRMLQSPAVRHDFLRLLAFLRRRRFDLVVDLQGLFRSGFLAWATGARARVGFADARELAPLFYTRRVRCPRPTRHAVEKNICMAAQLGLGVDPPRFPLGLRTEEMHVARRLLTEVAGRGLEHFTAVLPGARWPTKRWRADRIAALLDRLNAEGGSPCVLLGASADRAIADQVRAAATMPVIDLVGRTTLRQLVALLSLADRVICQDSGPMHIAAALNKPLVAVFGPTDPAHTGPYSTAARVVALPLACVPCGRRTCPLGHHACMQQLETDTVLAQVRELPVPAVSS